MANTVLVGTGLTYNYFPKTQHFRFFETLQHIGDQDKRVRPFAILLDYTKEQYEEMRRQFPGVLFVAMGSDRVKAPNPNKCLQHGAFVDTLVEFGFVDEKDYVIFTDSDMTVQRPFEPAEVDVLLQGKGLAAVNWHDGETLIEELTALGPTVPPFAVQRTFPGIDRFLCFNTGVLGLRVPEWQRLFKSYVARYGLVSSMMQHYARQQWLISWIIHTYRFDMLDPHSEFVRTVHTHGHEPRASERLAAHGIQFDGDTARNREGKLVVFAHNLKR